jgi:AcrR family transcriptional regulator
MTTGAVRARARKQPAEVRRETVLDAAMTVFARQPYRAAGTAEIARAAGIAEPTIYRHFSSKRELYLAAVQRTCEMVEEAWQALIGESANAEESLMRIGEWYEQSVQTNNVPVRLRMRAIAEADGEDVSCILRDGYKTLHRMVRQQIERGQSEGFVSAEVDAGGAAWVYIGMGKILDLASIDSLPVEVFHGCANGMASFFVRGLGAPAASIARLTARQPARTDW